MGDGRMYEHTEYLHPIFNALILLCIATSAAASVAVVMGGEGTSADAFGVVIAVVVLVPVWVVFSRTRVEVTQEEVVLTWGLVGRPQSRFSLSDVEAFRVITFRPLWDFGGWGWRMGRGGSRCYNLRGSTGVELRIAGRSYIIGVSDAQGLAEAIQTATGKQPETPGDWASGAA